MNKTMAIRITGAVATAALTVVALAGCGSSHAVPAPIQAAQVSTDRAICVQLASATAVAGTQDNQNLAPLEDVGTTIVDDAAADLAVPTGLGRMAPTFTRDAQNVAANLVWPSTDQIAKLQADCMALGVTDPIWPSWYHL
jgi:hypothetical protein